MKMQLEERKSYALKQFFSDVFKSKREILEDKQMSLFHQQLRSNDPAILKNLITENWKLVEELVERPSDRAKIKKKFGIK